MHATARNRRTEAQTEVSNGSSKAVRHEAPSYDAATRRALKLWVVLSRARASVGAHAERDIAGHGLTQGEFAILEVLYHRGPLLLGEVKRRILATSGGVTYLVDRLVKQGLVERRDCPGDRRARYAALTSAGESFVRDMFPGHAAAVSAAVAGLTAAEQRTAIELLRKLGLTAASSIAGEV